MTYTPFSRSGATDEFSCGSNDLDEFLNTPQVVKYESLGYGATTLVWIEEELVAYYTVGPGEIDSEQIQRAKKERKKSKPSRLIEEYVPAVKIARLAVASTRQKTGIGRILIAKIANDVVQTPSTPHLLVVRANPGSIDFYEKCGFQSISAHQRRGASGSLTLFFSLDVLHSHDVRSDIDL
ncbi:MAG TPA: GNAT family N-acetyltransferase [Thermoplasmata archaeon]|nr:GNAT family N-acetyltransferase [Thermoplasmata archaeon]